jgi:hypothetical protein
VLAGIRATAGLVAGAPGCQWWWSHLDRSAQRYVQWTARDDPDDDSWPPPRPGHAARMLRDGDRWADEHEQSLHKYRLPAGSGPGGLWWSCPFPGCFPTTRRLGSLGAVLLAGREDGFGDTEAVLWPLAVAGAARVYEIDGPADWQRPDGTLTRPTGSPTSSPHAAIPRGGATTTAAPSAGTSSDDPPKSRVTPCLRRLRTRPPEHDHRRSTPMWRVRERP